MPKPMPTIALSLTVVSMAGTAALITQPSDTQPSDTSQSDIRSWCAWHPNQHPRRVSD
jgi:hypothetical protein